MSVDITDAIGQAVRRTTARNGLVLVGIVYVLGVVSGLFGPRRPAGTPPGPDAPAGLPGGESVLSVPEPVIAVSPLVATFVSFVFTLLSLVVAVGAIRILVESETERLPVDAFTRRIGPTFINAFLGGIVFFVAVFLGLILLVVPGIFLLVSLAFWLVFVVDADANFVEGFRRSWDLTGGHRIRLFLLGFAVAVVGLLVNLIFGLAALVLGRLTPILGVVVGQVGSAFITVFTWATLAAAYNQLRDGGAADAVVEDDEFKY